MRTDQLIRAMAADTELARPVSVDLLRALALGSVVVAVVALPMLGPRADWVDALGQVRVLLKQAFPILLAIGAGGAALRLARPGATVGRWALPILAVAALLALAVGGELVALPRSDWLTALLGQTLWQCLLLVSSMALPMLGGFLWALRGGATTRPALSGAFAGLLAGGTAAALYAIHCTEDSPLFYGVWYVLAILSVTGLGAILGPRALRW